MIHHVALECERADRDAHERFWTALGFVRVDPPQSLRERAAWYERGGTQIHLLWSQAPRAAGHVAIRVDDLDALALELEERARHWGARRVCTRAPGGHTVELFEQPPPASAYSQS